MSVTNRLRNIAKNKYGKGNSPAKTIGLWFLAILLIVVLTVSISQYVRWQKAISNAQLSQSEIYARFGFDPGYIISDKNFYDSNSMTVDEIQSFLATQGSSCSGELCLKNLRVEVSAQSGESLCTDFAASGAVSAQNGESKSDTTATMSAAEIIDIAARACGISQKVLLVMLEKEQSLISSSTVSETQIKSALGLSCPDDGACDTKYKGFFAQVYGAAKRFKYYLVHPSEYKYHAQEINSVQYHPNVSCGASDVYIYNSATALLYIYTPYQPNLAALEAGYGEGDMCSAYGNRNFALLYRQYFGSPTA